VQDFTKTGDLQQSKKAVPADNRLNPVIPAAIILVYISFATILFHSDIRIQIL
jgi:hypothetical protein